MYSKIRICTMPRWNTYIKRSSRDVLDGCERIRKMTKRSKRPQPWLVRSLLHHLIGQSEEHSQGAIFPIAKPSVSSVLASRSVHATSPESVGF